VGAAEQADQEDGEITGFGHEEEKGPAGNARPSFYAAVRNPCGVQITRE